MGVPMGLQFSITAIGSTVLQAAVNGLGAASIAAMTSAFKVQILMVSPMDALGTTMATFGAQNYGAGKLERVDRGLRSCILLGVGYSLFAFGVLMLFADKIVLLFLNAGETDIIGNAARFLHINAVFYIPLVMINIFRPLIQGLGYSKVAMFAGVFEMAARILVASVFVPRYEFLAVCFANPTAWIMADLFLIPVYIHVRRILRDRIGLLPEKERALKES